MYIHLPTPEENPGYHNITAAIGRCITCWARVEDELANIFNHMTREHEDASQHYASRGIFYSVRSFEARLDLLSAAMKGPPILNNELQSEWTTLLNLLGRKGKKRNEIAHCAIIETVGGNDGGKHFADPYCAYSSKLDQDKTKLISEKHLSDRAQGFVQLAVRVALYQKKLALHLGRQQTSALLFAFPHLHEDTQTTPNPQALSTPPVSSGL